MWEPGEEKEPRTSEARRGSSKDKGVGRQDKLPEPTDPSAK